MDESSRITAGVVVDVLCVAVLAAGAIGGRVHWRLPFVTPTRCGPCWLSAASVPVVLVPTCSWCPGVRPRRPRFLLARRRRAIAHCVVNAAGLACSVLVLAPPPGWPSYSARSAPTDQLMLSSTYRDTSVPVWLPVTGLAGLCGVQAAAVSFFRCALAFWAALGVCLFAATSSSVSMR